MNRTIPLTTFLLTALVGVSGCGDSPEGRLDDAWDALCTSFIECDDPELAPPPSHHACVKTHHLCNDLAPTPECASAMADFTQCIASQPCDVTAEALQADCGQAEQAWNEACGDIEPPIRFLEFDPLCQFKE